MKLRHWKQRLDPTRRLVFRKPTVYGGVFYEVGDDLPDILINNRGKLENLWESEIIEIKDFSADGKAKGDDAAPEPQPQPEPEPEPQPEQSADGEDGGQEGRGLGVKIAEGLGLSDRKKPAKQKPKKKAGKK